MSEKTLKKKLRDELLSHLREHKGRAFTPRELSRRLSLTDDASYGRFRDVLDELEAESLVKRENLKYQLHPDVPVEVAVEKAQQEGEKQRRHKKASRLAEEDPNKAVGVLSVHPQGYGFVEVEGREEDYFIRESQMGTALDGDIVLIGLRAKRAKQKDRRRECEVLDVVERKRTQIVGTLRDLGNYGFVKPDDQSILQDVYVPKEAFGGAKEGHKVVVSVDRFEERKASPEGRILSVLGESDDPGIRVLSLAMSMDIKSDFPDEVERETDKIAVDIPEKEVERRLDLRDKTIFTIDPADAKDFDDAIHIERLDNGNYELGVHIADVSHYVNPGTSLDTEALSRGNSTYLVDRTIPMLPEKLSNLVCSLRPHEDKLAFSCIMEVTTQGEVVDYDIRETIIHSKERLVYDKAQDYLDGGHPGDKVASNVVQAGRLARTLTKKRMREGSVDFDLAEVKVILDDEGTPVDIVRKKRMEANRLIEEFMLLTNRTVARHIAEQQDSPKDFPFPYRVHDQPDSEGIVQLAEYVRLFGYELAMTNGNVKSVDLNNFLSEVKGTPEETVIERAALRSMSKAEYSANNIGHYGLGFKYYTHFTSPIRRYPDLIVHRLLKRYAKNGNPADYDELENQLEHCSERERNAVEAERESVKLKQVEYVKKHVGEEFHGVVTGVTKFGVFVEMTELLVEGLVHVRDMNDDYYEYDESTYTLAGENSGKTYRPGDTVEVKITAANEEKREVDLIFV